MSGTQKMISIIIKFFRWYWTEFLWQLWGISEGEEYKVNSEYKAVLQSVEDELPFQITWYDALESLLSIDSVLVSCEEQLDKVDLGVNDES